MNGFLKFVVTFLLTQGVVNGLPQYIGYPFYSFGQYGAMNYNNNPPDYMYNNGPTFGGIAGPAYELEQPNNIYSTNKGGTNVPRGGNSLVSLGGPNGYDNGGNVQRVKNVATHGGQINNLNQNINNESNTLGNFYYNSNNNCLGCTQSTENLTTNNEKLNKTNNNNLSENNKTNYVSY